MSNSNESLNLPKVSLINLGCAKNTVDSESALGRLLSSGFTFTDEMEDADLLLINTCGFIQSAKEEAISHIMEALELKDEQPDLKVVAMGCLVQRYCDELAEEIPELDGLVGFDGYRSLPQLCRRILDGEKVIMSSPEGVAPIEEAPRLLLGGDASAYLRLADGCDNRCAYCAVPLIRGGFRSRPLPEIVNEARHLIESGIPELCLIAQDTTSYGKDLGPGVDLPTLLRQLLELPGDTWFRLLYAHPAFITDEVIELLAREERLLRYLDLPIQHISDSVLRRMGRMVSRADIERILDRLEADVPGLVLRTSLIAGFPGETENDFAELLDFVRAGRFQHLGAFTYSPEEGTEAVSMGGQVSIGDATARTNELMLAQQEVTFRWLDSRIGNKETLLMETSDALQGWTGRSHAEAPDVDGVIRIKDGSFSPGQRIEACLVSRDQYDLIAQ